MYSISSRRKTAIRKNRAINIGVNTLFLLKEYIGAIGAGGGIFYFYNDGVDIDVNLKSDRTPITLADCESHTLIKSYLGPTHIPLLSEEGRDLLYEERRQYRTDVQQPPRDRGDLRSLYT